MGDMKHEYHEGPKAGENLERLARAVLQAPKVAAPKENAAKSQSLGSRGFCANR
jgi:hypothetical protein